MSSNKRSSTAHEYRAMYKLARWRRLREGHLASEPLCRYCLQRQDVTAAEVVDHIKPHRGDPALFYNPDNLMSLCKPCHDKTKQLEEHGRLIIRFGEDGWPI